jgi:hypothetical protein
MEMNLGTVRNLFRVGYIVTDVLGGLAGLLDIDLI